MSSVFAGLPLVNLGIVAAFAVGRGGVIGDAIPVGITVGALIDTTLLLALGSRRGLRVVWAFAGAALSTLVAWLLAHGVMLLALANCEHRCPA